VSGETLVPIAAGGNNSGTAPGRYPTCSAIRGRPGARYILNSPRAHQRVRRWLYSGGGGIPGNTVFAFTGTSMK